ncbi:hypothetical protein [Streptomyces antibioticus]|uniref:hypothetical protein n=1 Tax=Streptomyces antibioticus TaxID=1890 RepID=UPI0036D77C35
MDDTPQTPQAAATEPPKAGSTSSTPPAASPAADSVTALGERILTELGEDRTNNTLTRWLAHHTARLIKTADQAYAVGAHDADARGAQAQAAILQLWHARSDWPTGWPPPQAAETAKILNTLPSLDTGHWYQHTVPAQLHDIHHQVLAALLDLAAADAPVDIEQAWLDAYGDHLTEDETAMLQQVVGKPRRLDALLHWNDLHGLLGTNADNDDHETDTGAESTKAHPLVKLADAYRDAVLALVAPFRVPAAAAGEPAPHGEGQGDETAIGEAPQAGTAPGTGRS